MQHAANQRRLVQVGQRTCCRPDRHQLMVRAAGLVREGAKITLTNLAYNTRRLVWIDGRNPHA